MAADLDDAKRRGVMCTSSRDGRVHLHLSMSTTLSIAKVAVVAAVAVLISGYVIAEMLGADRAVQLHKRVQDLEYKLGRRLEWVYKHRDHLRAHLAAGSSVDSTGAVAPAASGAGSAVVVPGEKHADGRRHLLVPPGGVSRLAQALAPATKLHTFDEHYLCGDEPVTEADVVRKTVALAAITYRAPKSLGNSLESWRSGGLLDIVDEKMLFINSPTPEDHDLAREYDLDVYTTDEHNGNVMVGPALAYLVGNSSADYILLMEKDFLLSAPQPEMLREMYAGVQLLARGVHSYRLRGKTDHPAEGMPDCCAPPAVPGGEPNCPFHSNWKSAGYFSDHMNWLFIYCDPDIMEHSNGRLAKCTSEPEAPDSYCYTSGETNWSNNPVLFPREWFMQHIREVALADFERNNMFEFNVMLHWLPKFFKVCSSYRGIFKHFEIDQ